MIRAIETNLEGFLQAFCSTPASWVLRTPEYTQVVTPVPLGMFNLVVGAKLPPGEAEAHVAILTRRFAEHELPACWWITPSTQPGGLEALLGQSGWIRSNTWQGMARELERVDEPPGLPDALDVRAIAAEAEVAEWLSVFRRGFGTSERLERTLLDAWRGKPLPFTLYLARRRGEASPAPPSPLRRLFRRPCGSDSEKTSGAGPKVPSHPPAVHPELGGAAVADGQQDALIHPGEAVGTALVFRTDTVAGVYCVCTLPEARRTGVATALMERAMYDAERQGCRSVIVQSTEMGKSLYRRLGFTEAGRFRMLERVTRG